MLHFYNNYFSVISIELEITRGITMALKIVV